MSRINSLLLYFGTTIILMVITMQTANAIPAFARKYNAACSACHTAVPTLSVVGRNFKLNGYRFAANEKPQKKFTDHLGLGNAFPISFGIISRPYDKKKNGTTNNRALHEVELFAAGTIGNKLSGFIEMEAEDEDGFGSVLSAAQVTYSYTPQVNLQASYGSNLWTDPYDTYSDMRRLTRGHSPIVDKSHGGADGAIRKARQNVSVFGTLNKLFYSIAYSGPASDKEGHDANTITGRVAYNFTPNLMLGAMSMSGSCTVDSGNSNCTTVDRDYTRYGVDFQADVQKLRFNGAYITANDDNASGIGDTSTDAYFMRLMYINNDSGRPDWVPMVRFDNYELNDGTDNVNEVSFQMNYYFDENVRAMVEYWDRSGADTLSDSNRLTLQLYAYF